MTDEDAPPAWFTEAQRARTEALTVGQRVRIDLGECRGVTRHHGTQEQGAMGTVIGISPEPREPGHPFIVLFDRQLRALGCTSAYSAAELVPITTEEWMAAILGRLD